MFRRIRPTLAILVACVGVPLVAVGAAPATGDITVYRCQAGTQVTLQDEPCPAGQTQTTRRMVRPQDAPAPAPARAASAPANDAVMPPDDAAYAPPPYPTTFPPPPMFQCTDYDGGFLRYGF